MQVQETRLGDRLVFEPGDRVFTPGSSNGPGTVLDKATATKEELIEAIGTYFGEDWQLIRYDNGYLAPLDYNRIQPED
jgi:uncharacterized membrane-anchored protein